MTPLKPRELLWYLPGHGGGVTLTEARTHPKSAVLCLVWSRRIHAGVNSAMLLSHSHLSTIPPSAPPAEQSIHRRVLQEPCLIQEGKYSSLRQHQRRHQFPGLCSQEIGNKAKLYRTHLSLTPVIPDCPQQWCCHSSPHCGVSSQQGGLSGHVCKGPPPSQQNRPRLPYPPEPPGRPNTSQPCQLPGPRAAPSQHIPEQGVEKRSLLFHEAGKQQQLVANSKAGLFHQDQQDSRQTAREPICK